jgi:hypothetical protein
VAELRANIPVSIRFLMLNLAGIEIDCNALILFFLPGNGKQYVATDSGSHIVPGK